MADFEEPWSEEQKHLEEDGKLDRGSILNPSQPARKKFGYFGLILMGAAALLLIVLFNGKDKSKEGIQKEQIEFEPSSKRQILLPESLPSLPVRAIDKGPSEEDLARLKQEEALRLARLKSAILVYGSNGAPSVKQSPSDLSENKSTDPNTRFQQDVGNASVQKAKASKISSLGQMILQGKLIDAVLETAIHSDLPGMVRAIVSYDVYAESGNPVLIPRGSRLIGQYNSEVTKGQSRVFVVWTRVIRPDGVEVALNSSGTDPLGRAGIGGAVNHHFWQIFGASTLLSIIGGGTASGGVSTGDQNNSIAAYRQQLAQGFQSQASNLLGAYINIPPTIEIKQGSPIKVFVARDLDFSEAFASLSSHKGIVLE